MIESTLGLELYDGEDGEEGKDGSQQEGIFMSEARESLKEACTVVVEDAINAVLLGLRESVSPQTGVSLFCCLGYFTPCSVCICVYCHSIYCGRPSTPRCVRIIRGRISRGWSRERKVNTVHLLFLFFLRCACLNSYRETISAIAFSRRLKSQFF